MLCGRVTLFASLPLIDLFVVAVAVVVTGDTFVLIVNTLAKCIRYCINVWREREVEGVAYRHVFNRSHSSSTKY